jgi:hypothetical protein
MGQVRGETMSYDKARTRRNKEASQQRAREYVASYFSTHPCADCQERNPSLLTFDHVRDKKRDNISDMVRDGLGIETIRREIEKCDVVCFNCHSLREQQRSGAYRWRMGKLGRGE